MKHNTAKPVCCVSKISSYSGCQSKEVGVDMEVRVLSVGTRGLFFSPLRDSLSRLRRSIPSSSKRKKNPLAPRVILGYSAWSISFKVANAVVGTVLGSCRSNFLCHKVISASRLKGEGNVQNRRKDVIHVTFDASRIDGTANRHCIASDKLLIKQGPLDKQLRREAGSLCRSGSAIFLNET